MFTADAKHLSRLAPTLCRALIVDPNPTSAKLLAELLKGLGVAEMMIKADGNVALEACREYEPTIVFIEHHGPHLDGEAFARALRRSNLACRRVPVIMVTGEATAAAILGARDAGVHEFLRKPFASGDLTRRIEVVALKPRNWIEAVGYVGPDRRRFNSGEYKGPRKRKGDAAGKAGEGTGDAAAEAKDQAMRILASALNQFDSDPAQALRAIREQSAALKALAMKASDTPLVIATAGLERTLAAGRPTRPGLTEPIRAVLALAAPETRADIAA